MQTAAAVIALHQPAVLLTPAVAVVSDQRDPNPQSAVLGTNSTTNLAITSSTQIQTAAAVIAFHWPVMFSYGACHCGD